MSSLNSVRKNMKTRKRTPVARENIIAAMASKSLPDGWKLLVSQANSDIIFIEDETGERYAISKEELLSANFDVVQALVRQLQRYLDEKEQAAAE